ncbi:MAG: glycine cleavage system protein T, partial [Pseudonocardiales bacterium]|nr:glycine cleavage system protein T [Pseudonocardiales bacterium]
GVPVGETTSGTFSPTLGTGIALALLDPGVRPGDRVEVVVRGRALPCEVSTPPFVPSHVR